MKARPLSFDSEPRVFILHSVDPEDEAFVQKVLLPAMKLPLEQARTSDELDLGELKTDSAERLIADAHTTLVVISEVFLKHGWNNFLVAMAATNYAARGGRLVPLWLSSQEMPLRIEVFETLDCRTEAKRARSLERLCHWLERPTPSRREQRCPYPGMKPYDENAASRLGGREQEVRELALRIANGLREVFLIGPSGSGKSSMLRAGLIPKLTAANNGPAEPFATHVMTPGSDPENALAGAKRWLDSVNSRALIAVDPLDDLFTLAQVPARHAFFAGLEHLRGDPRCHLVFLLRADFYGDLMTSALWQHVQPATRHDVVPLRGDKLRLALQTPASAVGVALAPSLLERLLVDAGDEPGTLPLLQEALVQMWEYREHDLLTLESYEQLSDSGHSGLAELLARRADLTLWKLGSEEDQRVAWRVLLRLVQFGEGRANTRRRRQRSELRGGEPLDVLQRVLQHLVEHRILVTAEGSFKDDPSVDLAHEVLITAWPRLHGWLESYRHHELRRGELDARARRWAASEDGAGLIGEGELREVARWFSPELREALGMSETLDAFLTASEADVQRRATDREANQQELRRRLARYYLTQGQSLLRGGRGAKAVPYLYAARELGASGPALGALFHWARQALPLHAAARSASQIAWAPDSARLALVEHDGIRVWDLGRDEWHHLRGSPERAARLEWSVDGRLLRVVTTTVSRAWDTLTSELVELTADQMGTFLIQGPGAEATTTINGTASDQQEAPAGQRRRGASLVVMSPDGTLRAEAGADRAARIWTTSNDKVASPLFEHPDAVTAAAWSPNGAYLATLAGGVFVWNALDPASRHISQGSTPPARCANPVSGQAPIVVNSPNGQTFAEARGKRAQIYSSSQRAPASTVMEHQDEIIAMAWSPEGARLATASADGVLRVWDGRAGYVLAPDLAIQGELKALMWSDDGSLLLAARDGLPDQTWPMPHGQGSDEDWRLVLKASRYRLENGDLVETALIQL